MKGIGEEASGTADASNGKDEVDWDELRDEGKSVWLSLQNLIPKDMSKDEYTIYIVVAVLCIIVCCVLCFVLKKLLLFGIIIVCFLALVYWYMYVYRN